MKKFIEILKNSNTAFLTDEPMKDHVTFKAGGNAAVFVEPKDLDTLKRVISAAEEWGIKYMVIGNGSNLLIKDSGYSGAVICLNSLNDITVKGDEITAMAGAKLSAVCKTALDNGLVGMEFAGGIPGTVGGGLFMNAGAYGGELKDIVLSADILSNGEIKTYSLDDLELSYRHSKVGELGVVISVTFGLDKGDADAGREKLRELNMRRKDKQPVEYPSAGSTFKRPEGHFAGALIEGCGLKGCRVGGACVSEKHAGFIINDKEATASHIIELIEHVQKTVFEKYGVELEPEVRIIGE